jgi:NSS family neurotransmitter:Na+ symporter
MPSFKTGKIIGVPIYTLWMFMVRFVCPVIIGMVILNMFGVFGS